MTIRIGVIGAGGRGKLAWHAHRPEDDVYIVAAADPREEILGEYRNRFGESCLVTRDYRELLEAELDAVFICSPDYLHEEHACAALERGLSVYLEKPMAITTEGCDRILETSRRHGATLFVGHNMRYMRLFRKMKQLIDQGCVGEVKSIWCRHFISYGGDAYFRDWHSERRFSNGLLLQKGVHDIDVIHWLAGGYSRNVSAFGNNAVYHRLPRRRPEERGCARFDRSHWPPMAQKGFSPVIDVEDQNVVIMELENGILATYMQCHFTPDACRNYTVIGTEGRLENYGDGPESPIMLWNQ
ncbi:MAG: gfo/Idh/MocA family oxidoreductase, partial [Lentisphaerae bacterium]